ncbi:hypothetical protein K0B04_03665 [Patescibacteria group bacterium]|nr:hypothetical protein [Patescibacteria group bacterium]
MSFKTPILIAAFNRVETTKRVFEVVRSMKPEKLFIALDGPRDNKVGEKEKCEEVKKVFENIDWKCDVKTLFRERNMGCPKAIPGAIDWMFSQVDEGIILEDDCVPNETFFDFCETMLEKYRNDNSVMMVGGTNFFPDKFFSTKSYFFSRYSFIWGWATWKRAWAKYDIEMKSYPDFKEKGGMRKILPNVFERFFWKTSFDNKYRGYHDNWDAKWYYTLFSSNGLGIVPEVNLITNIGSGPDASVTVNLDNRLILPATSLPYPLRHPDKITENKNYSRKTFRRVFLTTASPRNIFSNYFGLVKLKIKKCLKS